MAGRNRATADGVNTLLTSRRMRVWSGGSRHSSDHCSCWWKAAHRGSGSGRPTSAWLYRWVYARPSRRSRRVSCTSAKRVIVHCPVRWFQNPGVASRTALSAGYGSARKAGSAGSKRAMTASSSGEPVMRPGYVPSAPPGRPAALTLIRVPHPRPECHTPDPSATPPTRVPRFNRVLTPTPGCG